MFSGRNSLLAGNLTGNLQKAVLICPFSAARALDRTAIPTGWHEFPGPVNSKESLPQNRILRTRSASHARIRRCCDIGAKHRRQDVPLHSCSCWRSNELLVKHLEPGGRFVRAVQTRQRFEPKPSACCRTISMRFRELIRGADSVRKIAQTPCPVVAPRRAILHTLQHPTSCQWIAV
jgi:hypothetical protein